MSLEELDDGSDIGCMILPMVESNLLLPTVTVAEMAPIQPFDIKPNTPDWFLGYYPWRNLRVPVLSYETLNNQCSPKLNADGRVAILNSTGVDESLPFISFLSQSLPRSLRLTQADIENNEAQPAREFEMLSVNVHGEALLVPDLEKIEKAILALNLRL
ncbi:chemotaxis protein CheW [Agaribacterium haliotis]|uniref:chemotaxis protein CheW n=1 Tax=Agaribacterium haliotis TaxID=2013869 RepID=UPI000BB58B9B|nr:chemotaxis protein CheW [Agaribacterium haliotis]